MEKSGHQSGDETRLFSCQEENVLQYYYGNHNRSVAILSPALVGQCMPIRF